ncbi:hypothetical protein FOZ63_002756 [Perkinsus olseni]|uniref:Maleylacetoacetate isomerase n=1 Tax=Perkinsus olseni TaxID=32597 RepID=A0A7J6QGI0_PEROL|nr:hypothetical protein FOZ63_002756 [Perkinsus olseni]KAF4718076.1 hypothetical protein FOZ62_025823 [Perkinsus olseni]
MSLKLYTYFRSSAAYRVRIALQYKGLQYESIPVNLVEKEHQTAEYGKINPAMMVPSLVTPEGRVITQSIAIIDYLDSTYPETPRLIPEKGVDRTAALSIALTIACDTHPLQNLSVFQYASEVAGRDVRDQWVTHFIERGLSSVEELVQGGGYCVGQRLSIADVCLVPQVYNALRFQVPVEKKFPKIFRIYTSLLELPAVDAADPHRQPDCPLELRR